MIPILLVRAVLLLELSNEVDNAARELVGQWVGGLAVAPAYELVAVLGCSLYGDEVTILVQVLRAACDSNGTLVLVAAGSSEDVSYILTCGDIEWLVDLLVTKVSTSLPSVRRMSSVPVVMLPHWSLPPSCSFTP